MLWACTTIQAVVDLVLINTAQRRVSREQFRQMRGLLTVAGGIFFACLWTGVLTWAWDWFYRYIFPPWGQTWLPLIFGAGYTLIALAMAWLSLKLPGSPAVTWCVLGGVEGLLSHIYAIYALGAASKPHIMQGSDPLWVLIFAVFEKAFFWSMILLATTLIWKGYSRYKGNKQSNY